MSFKNARNLDEEGLPGGTHAPRWLELPVIEDPWGNLCFGQEHKPFPFLPARIFYIHGIPAGAVRGGHALKNTELALFCPQGACTLWLFDARNRGSRFRLDQPAKGVYIPSLWWVEIGEYLENTITLAVASLPYEEGDYIRQPEKYFHGEPYPDPFSRSRG